MISVFGSDIKQKEIKYVTECMKSNWLGYGKIVERFEEEYSRKMGVQNFLMVDNCSNALYMAIHLLNLPQGSEVILPSLTWVSCAQAILLCGHKPVFADVDYHTMNITREFIIDKITDKTKAIMVVHYAGMPVKMDTIKNLGFPVIEDAAHAICSDYFGKKCGTMSDVGCYSFDSTKNLVAGDGGGLVLKSKEMYERAKYLRYCGIGKSGFDAAADTTGNARWWEYNIKEPFIRMLPNNINASIALAQLERISDLQERRKQIWEMYTNALCNEWWINTPVNNNYGTHSYFTYCIKVKKRDELAKFLFDNGVYTTLRFHPLHLNPLYKQEKEVLQNTEIINREGLNIPLHPRMKDADVEKVVTLIKMFGAGNGF